MDRSSSQPITTKRALFTSFAVGITDVVLNGVVAVITGSTVMIAESLQGLADLSSISFLLVGRKRAKRASSRRHPFGYGKELYFWALLSAFLIFTLTAGLAFYFGYRDYHNPEPIDNLALAYIILGYGALSNGYAFSLNARRLLSGRPFKKVWRAFVDSHDVSPKTTYVLDLMGTLAASFGLIALLIYQITGDSRFDGIGAMAIAVMLELLAFMLLIGLKDLVTGRSAPQGVERRIRKAALAHPEVEEVLDLRTMIIGSDKILVNIEIHLKAGLTTNDIEQDIDEIKEAIADRVPSAYHIQVELETPDHEIKNNRHHKTKAPLR